MSDWSSDVCSSDLHRRIGPFGAGFPMTAMIGVRRQQRYDRARFGKDHLLHGGRNLAPARGLLKRGGRAGPVAHIGDGDLHRIDRKKHTSELQLLMRISYAVFCLKKKIPRATS